MLNSLAAHQWISFHGLVTAFAVGIFLLASRTLRQRRHPSAAIAWFLSLALIPYVALPIYLLVGNRKLARPIPTSSIRAATLAIPNASSPAKRLGILARSLQLPPPSTYDHFELHRDGSHALQSLLSVIDSARSSMDVCTFLLGKDVLGQKLMLHLVQSANRGVKVRLMIDGIGRYLGGHPDLRVLTDAGVSVALFSPPSRFLVSGGVNLRNHRKLAIADGSRMWLGGRNLAAEYFEGDDTSHNRKKPWIDMPTIKRLAGDLCAQSDTEGWPAHRLLEA